MSDAASVGFVVMLVVVLVTFAIAAQIGGHRELTRSYERLAQRFRGRCHVVGLWNRPSVNFIYNNAHALLDIKSTGGKHKVHYTQLRISWPDSRFRCEVYPEGVLSRVGKFLGMRDIEIGSPRFDADYVISGNDVRELTAFLTVEVQQRIDQLRALSGNFDIYLSVSGGQLLIKKRGVIRDYPGLKAFTLLSLDVFDQAIHAAAEGIEFVEAGPEAKLTLNKAVCQICGESVKLDAVFCRSCKTPHHKDCWEYYGACSTYGCGQRRYLAQTARP